MYITTRGLNNVSEVNRFSGEKLVNNRFGDDDYDAHTCVRSQTRFRGRTYTYGIPAGFFFSFNIY